MRIPWRYIIPNATYRKQIQIAKACPEIASLIDRAIFQHAFYQFLIVTVYVPMTIIVAPLYLILCAIESFKDFLHIERFRDRAFGTIRSAHQITTPEEIRYRTFGEVPPRIMDRK